VDVSGTFLKLSKTFFRYAAYGAVLLGLFAVACTQGLATGKFDSKSNLFRSNKYHCELQLPAGDSWKTIAQNQKDIIFEAYNTPKIIYVFIAAESLNTELEDYFLLLKMSNKFDQREGYQFIGKTMEKVNGEEGLRFIYSAEIADEQIGKQQFTYDNVLFKSRGMNYRLIIYTLSDAYERKREYINQIIQGFKFI
jgi:hypothetical protein